MWNLCSRTIVIVCLLTVCSLFCAVSFASNEPNSSDQTTSPEDAVPVQTDSILSTLNDEQIRTLLIEELKKNTASQSDEKTDSSGFIDQVAAILHILDDDGGVNISQYLAQTKRMARTLPTDLDWLLRQFSSDSSRGGGWRNIGLVLLVLSGGFLVEILFRLMTSRVQKRFMDQLVPDLSGMIRFRASVLRILPTVIHIAVLGVASVIIFIPTPLEQIQQVRYLFVALLFIIVAIRFFSALSQLFFSPEYPGLRLTPLSDTAARRTHNTIVFLTSYTVIAVSFLALIREVGIQDVILSLLSIPLATILLILAAGVVFFNRKPVAEAILSGNSEDDGAENWVMQMYASLWHVLVLCYLFIVWFFMLFQNAQGMGQGKGAFLFSLLLIPAFLLIDWLAKWIIRSIVETLHIYDPSVLPDDENLADSIAELMRKKYLLERRIQRFTRIIVLAALAAWGLRMWGYRLPYAAEITAAVFDSLLTLGLALIFWRFASNYIERKIKEATPEEEETEEDDEWGAAATRGRSFTLLPMVRKFIGTVLVVMVTLIIFSSLGVDIGPLLAGAGVIGLAIGFGAQKLVADVFSGFFYLLDDAFRVGEYLKAGNVSGSVEAITLRNVMLRHHRGMLQIVPYSELGAITNFMRGGIVVKFNLEFPYDSDIDKIRKIIKKVGQAMLQDPEFGEDFIRPVKSQGVREITSSVMVIRVKFTAKPGTHFVIRREAYRRITEALAAKGIHYAHRKVIVELPEETKETTSERTEKIRELGAAAGLAAMEEEANKKAGGQSDNDQTIPGM